MIRLVGFESQPIERVQLEVTGDDIKVIEWLRGRTTSLPMLFLADQAESRGLGLGIDPAVTEKTVKGFLQRLWEATGHMRCCADPSRGKPA